jgi:hypothetical protein
VKAAPDGTLYLPRDFCERPFVAVSGDDGTSWSAIRVADGVGLTGTDPHIAIDEAGNAYVAWLDRPGRLWLSTSTDAGQSWNDAVPVSPPGVTAHLPGIAATGVGHVAVSFLGTEDLPEGFLEPEFSMDPRPEEGVVMRAAWHAWVAQDEDVLAGGSFQASQVNGAKPLLRGLCDPRYCPGPQSDYNDAAFDRMGNAWAVFVDWCEDPCASWRDVRNDAPGTVALAKVPPI